MGEIQYEPNTIASNNNKVALLTDNDDAARIKAKTAGEIFLTNFRHSFFCLEKQDLSICVGCGGQIHDQYILRVAPDLEWHAACLKCQECRQFLDDMRTCFVRDGKTYCKHDYVR